ncbi:MAG TPA: ATP-binding protein, partial [Candidatus Binataceae bacterium]|nr:ATP-binding protein [Candidatus Binataceae bacterium]
MRQFQNSFVGREPELATLRGALDSLSAGRTRIFLISGEPGIGKTRLAEEVAAAAVSSVEALVVWGRCWEGGGAPAYWPWMQILRGLIVEPGPARAIEPGIPAELAQLIPELSIEKTPRTIRDPMEARFRLFDATASTLRELSRRQPIVLIIDDLQDADQSSLEMLNFVARTLPDANILIIATYRDAEVQRSPVLAATVAELAREAPQLLLHGFSPLEVAGFVQDRAGVNLEQTVVTTIAQATAGNPL